MLACLAPDLPAGPRAAAPRTARLKIASIRGVFGFSSLYQGLTAQFPEYWLMPRFDHSSFRIFLDVARGFTRANLASCASVSLYPAHKV